VETNSFRRLEPPPLPHHSVSVISALNPRLAPTVDADLTLPTGREGLLGGQPRATCHRRTIPIKTARAFARLDVTHMLLMSALAPHLKV